MIVIFLEPYPPSAPGQYPPNTPTPAGYGPQYPPPPGQYPPPGGQYPPPPQGGQYPPGPYPPGPYGPSPPGHGGPPQPIINQPTWPPSGPAGNQNLNFLIILFVFIILIKYNATMLLRKQF